MKVEEFDTPSVRAGVSHLRVSPSKVRQVLSLIRGLAAEDAERVLQLCQKDAADDVLKVLDSAVANEAAMLWAVLGAKKRKALGDIFIAATAMVHRLPLVTRNRRDFEFLAKVHGVDLELVDWTI